LHSGFLGGSVDQGDFEGGWNVREHVQGRTRTPRTTHPPGKHDDRMNALWKKVVRLLGTERALTTAGWAMLILLVVLAVLTAVITLGQASATGLR
jgi:hypothetical protein